MTITSAVDDCPLIDGEARRMMLYASKSFYSHPHSAGLYMGRRLNLRQIEAFKAVIEHGTVSRAAGVLNVSQPAISKLIAHLEADAEVRLFDRIKGRLAPTERGMRFYQEIERIFSGVAQIENAAEAIRREEQGRLVVGVMPALAGRFVQEVTMGFLRRRPNVFCSIESRS